MKSERESRFIFSAAWMKLRVRQQKPISTAAHEGMKPAIGPAIPISNKCGAGGDGAFNADKSSEGADEAGKGNEEWRRRIDAVMAGVEVVSHLVRSAE